MKYIVVTGGVISGIGKGITASSIGLLLRQSGFHISAIKIDPYLNLDAGTMSPFEHGECYVLDELRAILGYSSHKQTQYYYRQDL